MKFCSHPESKICYTNITQKHMFWFIFFTGKSLIEGTSLQFQRLISKLSDDPLNVDIVIMVCHRFFTCHLRLRVIFSLLWLNFIELNLSRWVALYWCYHKLLIVFVLLSLLCLLIIYVHSWGHPVLLLAFITNDVFWLLFFYF